MSVKEWEERLKATFGQGGVTGGILLSLYDAEKQYRRFICTRLRGRLVLMDSFFAFFMETLGAAELCFRQRHAEFRHRWYALVLLNYAILFRRFRAAEALLLHGYPFSGYALLRDIKDQAILLAASASGVSTWGKVTGHDGGEGQSRPEAELKERRKKEEGRVMRLMLGPNSGLSAEDQERLGRWTEMFHWEVHGSRLTSVMEGESWVKGETSLPIYPQCDLEQASMYNNTSCKLGWMLLRTFAFLQLSPAVFGAQWMHKWNVLDSSFREAVEAFAELGKPLGHAIIRFVEVKFPFAPDRTVYSES